MFVSRYCSIGLYVLLNLNVLCHGQHVQQPKRPLSNGNVAYPESEEEDPAKQNAQVNSTEILQYVFTGDVPKIPNGLCCCFRKFKTDARKRRT